jgi:hypothetical protein
MEYKRNRRKLGIMENLSGCSMDVDNGSMY